MNPTDLLIWLDWLEEMKGVQTFHLRRKVNKKGKRFRSRRERSGTPRSYGYGYRNNGLNEGNGRGDGCNGWGVSGFGDGKLPNEEGNGKGCGGNNRYSGNGNGCPVKFLIH